ncbi:MAG: hypothetical protein ACR2O4_06645 [Hyphomicrobiaceae bacterium]
MTDHRMFNGIVFLALLAALYMNWSWPWGVLFIYWAVPAYVTGEAFLVGKLTREDDAPLFWSVTVLWAATGVMMILVDAAPSVLNDLYAWIWRL